MAYASTTLQMLISAPGDVPETDRLAIERSISRWNVNYGKKFQLTVVVTWWGEHASPEFGDHPQDIINRQLIDEADLALAIFWSRLGTQTKNAVSGTAEEIERMAKAGKTVSILHCVRDIPVGNNLPQQVALSDYLESIRSNALVMTYRDEAELASRMDNILSRQSALFMGKVSESKNQAADQVLEVWPSVEFNERVETDRQGRLKTRRSHYLVLTNTGKVPAKNVTFSLEPGDDMVIRGDSEVVETLAPGGKVRFLLALSMGSPDQFNCTVKWTGPDGNEGENSATLRPA